MQVLLWLLCHWIAPLGQRKLLLAVSLYPSNHRLTYLYLSLGVPQRDAVGADGGTWAWSLLLPQDLRSCTDWVSQRGPLLIDQLLGSLRGSLRLHGAPPLPDGCSCSALLLHEQVQVALLRLLLLLLPAFVLHHQLADGFVRSDGVQFVPGAFPPFLSSAQPGPAWHSSHWARCDARVSPLPSSPEVMGQTACAAEKRKETILLLRFYLTGNKLS